MRCRRMQQSIDSEGNDQYYVVEEGEKTNSERGYGVVKPVKAWWMGNQYGEDFPEDMVEETVLFPCFLLELKVGARTL
jgi:hypothetical protein